MKWFKYILGFLGAVGALFAVNKAKSKEVQKLKLGNGMGFTTVDDESDLDGVESKTHNGLPL